MFRPLWLTDHYHPAPGGMARSCDRIVHHLRKSGVDIDLVHFLPSQKAGNSWRWDSKLNGADFRCTILHDRPHTLNLLWNEIKDQDYTHVVAFGSDTPLLAAPVFAAWLDKPLVTLLRGNDFDVGLFSRKKRDVLFDCLEASRSIGAVSSDKVEKIRALFPGKEIHYTPNGIDLETWVAFPSLQVTKNESRTTIGLLGQLKAKKGIAFFLGAISSPGLSGQIHLQITGNLEEDALRILEGMSPQLTYEISSFIPHSQMPSHFLRCDYVAIPSFYDGMPNVLLEAGALGIPVIASETGGILDLVEDQDHGFLFQNNNRASCITALNNALQTHDEERLSQGESLREHIANNFSHTKERDIFLSILRDSLPT